MTTDPIYEEARRCPKCTEPGEKFRQQPAILPNGVRNGIIHFFRCANKRCAKFGDVSYNWLCQVDATGHVPVLDKSRDKDFPDLPNWLKQKGSDAIEEVRNAPKGMTIGEEE